MKKLLSLMIVMLWIIGSYAQWVSPGNGIRYTLADLSSANIGAVTSLQNGNYYVSADLTISADDTLYLEASAASITVYDSVNITIKGVVVCETREDSLSISGVATAPDERFNLRFEEAPASTLSQVIFANANKIALLESPITFERCEFSNFTAAVISYMNCSPVIRNCYFHDNQATAISSAINMMGSPQILYNTFYNNVLSNANTPQINLGPGAVDTIFIVGNHIEGVASTMSGGIAIADLAQVGNTKARISNNTILHNRYGYTQQGYHVSALICDNIIQDNNLEVNAMNGGSGISIYGYTTDCAAKIRRNLISGNLWGITTIYYHNTDMGTAADPGNNIIYNNGNGGITYALYNNAFSNMNAVGNYWGGNSDTLAESVIFHQPDQSNLGLVTYLPIKALQPELISFDFKHTDNPALAEDVIGIVDTLLHTVSLHLPTDMAFDSLWIPTIGLPIGNTCTPASDTAHIFPTHGSVTYSVATPHGTSQDWYVTVSYANSIPLATKESVTLYPNPVGNGQFTVSSSQQQTMRITVYNGVGKCIFQTSTPAADITINTNSWGKGLYIVQIQQGKSLISKKITIL